MQQSQGDGNNKSKKSKPLEHKRMAITWFRPLQWTSSNDFEVSCQGATVYKKDEDHKVYLGPTSKSGNSKKNTLNFVQICQNFVLESTMPLNGLMQRESMELKTKKIGSIGTLKNIEIKCHWIFLAKIPPRTLKHIDACERV